MNYNFTDRVRMVLAMARDEAIRLRHGYVGTEHILLGLIREGEGVAAAVLSILHVDVERIREQVEASVQKGKSAVGLGELPYTTWAKKVLEYAMVEARELNHPYVGTEHLLLGLLREERGIAARVLNSLGVTLDDARGEALKLLGESGVRAKRPARRKVRGSIPDREQVWFLEIDQDSGVAIYEQIIARIEEAVATGRLSPGERLPSVRDLAAELGIAPGTVARAYTELEKRGVVETSGARGTRVADGVKPAKPGRTGLVGIERMLRRLVVAGFHRGARAQDLRDALERAMRDIFPEAPQSG
jgi:DNA-binding transcriptional regulator YhcF (GntR family)